MRILAPGDRIELAYEDAPQPPIRATVIRLLTDEDEGLGKEIEGYTAGWVDIRVDEPCGVDARQVLLLGTDLQYRLNGRPVTVRDTAD